MSELQSLLPNGPVPDRGPQVFGGTLATLVIATVFVVGRLISRHFVVGKISWDDRVMILAWLVAFFMSFTIILGVSHGLGRHDINIDHDQKAVLRRCEYIFSILYNPALALTKTSILIFYLRLARTTQVVLRYASYFLLVVVNLAAIVLTFMNLFQCNPISAAWNPFHEGDISCIPLLLEFICASPVNVITDLALLALPLATLAKMHLPTRQKVILILTFSLGIFVTVIDVVRIHELQMAISDEGATSTQFGGQADFAWKASLSFMWSAVEVNIGMACACVPSLKPLILKLIPSMLYDPDGSGPPTTRNGMATSQDSTDVTVPAATLSLYPTLDQPSPDTLSDDRDPMSVFDFLRRSDTAHGNPQNRASLTASPGRQENAIYFGFVNMAKPTSMLKTSGRESLRYCSTVTILFFLWGFSYGSLNTLNNVVASIQKLDEAQTLGLTAAYWGGGYFFGPLIVGEWILRRDEHNRSRRRRKSDDGSLGGFKVTFIIGLCIYGTGTIILWPSAVTNSYAGFMVSNCVVGFGLAILEVAANAFITLCGPSEYAETRVTLCHAVGSIGSVLSGLLANNVFFESIGTTGFDSNMSLLSIQWAYLAITMFCAALGLFFFYMPLPEVSDQELEDAAKLIPVDPQKKKGWLQLRTWSLILAIAVQYMYSAAQESNSIYFRELMISILPVHAATQDYPEGSPEVANPDKPPGIAVSIPDYLLIGHTAFCVSRFFASFLTYYSVSHPRFPRPRTLLAIYLGASFVFALLIVVIRVENADLGVIPVILFFFAEGPIWPLTFAIGLRGQGRRTKRAAAFITMGGAGGGIVPFLMYGIMKNGGSVRTSYIVIVVLQILMMCYPIFLEGVKDARWMVEPVISSISRPNTRSDEDGYDPNELNLAILATRQTRQGDEPQEPPLAATPDEKPIPAGFLGKVTKGLERAKLAASNRTSSTPDSEHTEMASPGSTLVPTPTP